MKEKIKKIFLVILPIITFFLIRVFLDKDVLFSLLITAALIAYIYYDNNKRKEKEIEQLKKDWSFCKELLDKERAKK